MRGHYSGSMCWTCRPPAGQTLVILLDAGSDREHHIYRSLHGRCVPLGKRLYPVPEDGAPLVIELPTSVWVGTRG